MSNCHKIIISISSDIGFYLAKDWLSKGISVSGTYRRKTDQCNELEALGAKLIKCDLSDKKSIDTSIRELNQLEKWNSLVVATGTQDPVGKFIDCDMGAWSDSISVNFTSQIRFIHGLLPNRSLKDSFGPSVLMFAGGGTNNATVNYSAYTISKIASIKMVELLDAEFIDTSFSIIGPGWVKTKIHNSTLQSKESAGSNYFKTLEMLEADGEKWYPMEKVIDCCNWILSSPRELVGGRNFSSMHDPWENDEIKKITEDENNFKLRRYGNDIFRKN